MYESRYNKQLQEAFEAGYRSALNEQMEQGVRRGSKGIPFLTPNERKYFANRLETEGDYPFKETFDDDDLVQYIIRIISNSLVNP